MKNHFNFFFCVAKRSLTVNFFFYILFLLLTQHTIEDTFPLHNLKKTDVKNTDRTRKILLKNK